MQFRNRSTSGIDFILLGAVLGLLTLGLIMVFSSSMPESYLVLGDPYHYFKRQALWTLIGLSIMAITMRLDYTQLERVATPALALSLMLLTAVLIVGVTSRGSARWIDLGALSFQPSEVIKPALILYAAVFLARRAECIRSFRRGILPLLLVLGAACLLILAQPDLGTAVVLAGTTYLLLAAAGARRVHLTMLLVMGLAAAGTAIRIAPYRMQRFLAFLDPGADPKGSGYQTLQSLLALGSGGLAGLGLGMGRQKLFYVPERHTDFILAIIGEELGFVGVSLVLVLFLVLAWRGTRAALRARDTFGSLIASGLTFMILLQALVNIGVVSGVLPVTGITLPFISYGGSSLVFSLASVGLILSVSRQGRI